MDNYTELAKNSIEEYVIRKKIVEVPDNLPEEFYTRRAGIFVSLHKNGELRGCIGTILPTRKNIAEEIISNAIAACSRDNRFSEVTQDDLNKLKYEVSILNEPKPVKNFSEHNPKKHGIIARCPDGRCGLLLPDLPGVDSTDQQINIACQKGGIDTLEDNPLFSYFTVEKHS